MADFDRYGLEALLVPGEPTYGSRLDGPCEVLIRVDDYFEENWKTALECC